MADVGFLSLGQVQGGLPSNTPSFTNQAFSASTTKMATVFQAMTVEPITHLGFRYGVRTGTPPAYKIGLQGLTTAGQPDGTYKGGGTPASAVFTPPASTAWDATFQWIALDNAYTPAVGEFLAWVVEYSSGTIDASNNSTIGRTMANVGTGRVALPYGSLNTGSWAKSAAGYPLWGWKGATSAYGFPVQLAAGTAVSVDGNRAAMRFTMPAGSANLGVGLIKAVVNTPTAAASNWVAGIWNAAGGAVQTITVDSDFCGQNNFAVAGVEVTFPSPAVLSAGQVYYAGVERSGTNISLWTYDAASAGDMAAFWGGAGLQLATWNGSAWTPVATSRPLVELVLRDVTGAAIGGGMNMARVFTGY